MKKIYNVKIAMGFIALMLLSSLSFANVVVNPPRSILITNGKASRAERSIDYTVRNTESETIQLISKLQRVYNPGTDHEKYVTLENGKQNLFFFPAVLEIASGATKNARLLYSGSTSVKTERLYVVDVDFKPETLKLLTPKNTTSSSSSGKSGKIRFLVKQASVLHLLPLDIMYAKTVTRNGNKVTVKNNGTVHFRVYTNFCTEKMRLSKCTTITSLYPGSSKTFDIKRKTTLTIEKRRGFPGKFKKSVEVLYPN